MRDPRWVTRGSLFLRSKIRAITAKKDPRKSTELIEVSLRGGLGNQLFGFAAGLTVAARLDVPLRLSTELLGSKDPNNRRFELEEVAAGNASWGKGIICQEAYAEKSFAYDTALETVPAGFLLDGYFQSERYFLNYRTQVKEVICRAPSFAAGRAEFEGRDFIGLQIRRGDYLHSEQREFHGLATVEYFARAATLLRKLHGELPIVVFTDDPASLGELLTAIDRVDVHEPATSSSSLNVLGALSAASSICISNSSFGWWAAWLLGETGQVIAPRPWFKNRAIDTTDLLPDSWLTIGGVE